MTNSATLSTTKPKVTGPSSILDAGQCSPSVGMDYTLNGFAEWIDASTVSNETVLAYNERHQGIPGGYSMQNVSVEPGNTLGAMEDLELAARFIEFHSSMGSTIGFHNASVQLPIRTQA